MPGAAREPRRRRARLAQDEKPRRRRLELAPPAARATAATRSGSAVSADPEHDEPARSNEREAHSAATGGCASAFATATPKLSVALLLRPPPDDREVRELGRPAARGTGTSAAPPRAGSLRGRAARRRAGSRASRRPSRHPRSALRRRRRARTARSASSSRTRRAAAGSRSAVRPGVASTRGEPAVEDGRSSPRSSVGGAAGKDDDEAVRLAALARRLDLGIVLQQLVHDLAARRPSSARAPPGDRSPPPARRCAAADRLAAPTARRAR